MAFFRRNDFILMLEKVLFLLFIHKETEILDKVDKSSRPLLQIIELRIN